MAETVEAKVEGTGTRVVSLKAFTGNAPSMRAVALELAIVSGNDGFGDTDDMTSHLLKRAERFYQFMMQTPDRG